MHNLPTNVQLLTLLNVSAAKPSKKKRGEEDVARDWVAEAKRIEARKGKKAKLDLGQLAETATAADVAQDEAVDQGALFVRGAVVERWTDSSQRRLGHAGAGLVRRAFRSRYSLAVDRCYQMLNSASMEAEEDQQRAMGPGHLL